MLSQLDNASVCHKLSKLKYEYARWLQNSGFHKSPESKKETNHRQTRHGPSNKKKLTFTDLTLLHVNLVHFFLTVCTLVHTFISQLGYPNRTALEHVVVSDLFLEWTTFLIEYHRPLLWAFVSHGIVHHIGGQYWSVSMLTDQYWYTGDMNMDCTAMFWRHQTRSSMHKSLIWFFTEFHEKFLVLLTSVCNSQEVVRRTVSDQLTTGYTDSYLSGP